MLGRVRRLSSSSSSSLESLERPSPKIIKHDSLSIYEATIMKLKLASQLDLSSTHEEGMTMETDDTSTSVSESSQNKLTLPLVEAMKMETRKETKCSSVSVSKSYLGSLGSPYEEPMSIDGDGISLCSGDCQSIISMNQPRNKNLSIACLFSKYKSSQHAQSSPSEETDNGVSATSVSSSSSSEGPSMGSM